MFLRFEGEGEGGLHCLPYFIALDHAKQAVVLAIRGTLALQHTVPGMCSPCPWCMMLVADDRPCLPPFPRETCTQLRG